MEISILLAVKNIIPGLTKLFILIGTIIRTGSVEPSVKREIGDMSDVSDIEFRKSETLGLNLDIVSRREF